MKLDKNFNNEALKEALKDSKIVYNNVLNNTLNKNTMDDEEYEYKSKKLEKVRELEQMDKDILYLYAEYGATEAAELLGVSRGYIYKLMNNINKKLKLDEEDIITYKGE